MAWRRDSFESIWREMDEMRAELDHVFRQVPSGARLLPAGGVGDRMLPAIRGEFRVDVREHEEDVIVVADLPGADKEAVSLDLLNPRALEISCERRSENEEIREGYYMRERVSGSMSRIVALPTEVTEDDAKASFKNGVLEVILKKSAPSRKSRIMIE
jgi:HSP20 family protein